MRAASRRSRDLHGAPARDAWACRARDGGRIEQDDDRAFPGGARRHRGRAPRHGLEPGPRRSRRRSQASSQAGNPVERLRHLSLRSSSPRTDAAQAASAARHQSRRRSRSGTRSRERERLAALCDEAQGRRRGRAHERALHARRRDRARGSSSAKQRLGALDFDDLIDKTLALLSRGDARLGALQARPRHRPRARRRGAGHEPRAMGDPAPHHRGFHRRQRRARRGACARSSRSGDPKQSIFGFQGAAPREFEASRRYWKRKVARAPLALRGRAADAVVPLRRRRCSRRSTRPSPSRSHFKGLSFEDKAVGTVHESARPERARPRRTVADRRARGKNGSRRPGCCPVDEPERHSPPVVVAAPHRADRSRCWTTKGDEAGPRLERRRHPGAGAQARRGVRGRDPRAQERRRAGRRRRPSRYRRAHRRARPRRGRAARRSCPTTT